MQMFGSLLISEERVERVFEIINGIIRRGKIDIAKLSPEKKQAYHAAIFDFHCLPRTELHDQRDEFRKKDKEAKTHRYEEYIVSKVDKLHQLYPEVGILRNDKVHNSFVGGYDYILVIVGVTRDANVYRDKTVYLYHDDIDIQKSRAPEAYEHYINTLSVVPGLG